MRGRFVRAGAKVLLLCSAVAFSLLIVELALRLFYPQTLRARLDAYAAVPGSRYYGLRANYRERVDDAVSSFTFATNSYGIRDAEFDSAEAHPRRVIFLGDHFTQGVGVDLEETFVKQFEHRMEAATGQDWQALNLGLGGGTFDAIHMYRTKGIALPHRYVVLGFYMNDMRDNLAFQRRPLRGHDPRELEVAADRRVRAFLGQNSHLWNLLAARLDWPVVYRLRVRSDQSWFSPYVRVDEPGEVRRAWALTFGALKELTDLARSRNAELLLLVLPTKVQVDRDVFTQFVTGHDLKVDQVQFDRPQRMLKKFAAEAGIPVIDVLDSVGHRANHADVYYNRRDNHFNERGYAATGAILARVFLERCGSRC
jgi:hypothetical protein